METIDHDYLFTNISIIDFNLDPKNVDPIVDNYTTVFTSLLDKHAPLNTDYVVPRDVQPWIISAIRESVKGSGSGENLGWRFIALCLILKNIVHGEKERFSKKLISDCSGD